MQDILTQIDRLKEWRGFNAAEYITKKVRAINNFFRDENLDAAVVGLSGGIDSSLVLALLQEAKKQPGSPIKRIRAVVVPICCNGATGQEKGVTNAIGFLNSYIEPDIEWILIDGTKAFESIVEQCQSTTPWANGQMVSILRTPIFYYQAAVMQTQGLKSLVCGTTNRTELEIGFYGKASDGMNDLQVISDLFKYEVYEVARQLGLPAELIDQNPEGGVWDGRNDEQLIGAPYWFVDGHLLAKQYKVSLPIDCPQHQEFVDNIEKICKVNEHKTRVGLPSRNINII